LRDADDAVLVEELRLLAGQEAEVFNHPSLLRLTLPALRADYRMLDDYTYVPGPGLDCPVVALAGDRDPRVAVDKVARWERETQAGFAMQVLPGGHFFVDEHLPYIAETIGSRL
jgi:surfactin synthase thioesterase subunit